MSLESVIAENTSAIRELIGLLSRMPTPPAAEAPHPELPLGPAQAPKTKAEAKAKVKEAEPEPAPSTPAEAEVSYASVSQAVLAVVRTKGRDHALQILTNLGVSNAKELKPEQYPQALSQLEAALAA